MENDIEAKNIDLKVILSNNGKRIQEEFLPIVSVLPAQLLGFYKSLKFGLNPDLPSTNGMIHRVVRGVKVYNYQNDLK
jgi:tagatose-6-phosphate ketose/aldose isomerase